MGNPFSHNDDYTVHVINKTGYTLEITGWWWYPQSGLYTNRFAANLFINKALVYGGSDYTRTMHKLHVNEGYIHCKIQLYAPSKNGYDILTFYTSSEYSSRIASYHDVYYVKKGDYSVELTVENTADQLQEIKVQEIFKEALKELQEGKLKEALEKFENALKLTKDESVKTQIRDNIRIAQNKGDDIKAQELHKIAMENFQKGLFDQAVNKLEEALRLAHDASLRESLNRSLGNVYGGWGEKLEKEAYDLERDQSGDNSGKAKDRFEDALEKYTKASEIDSNYVVNVSLVKTKITANELFNFTNLLEKQAYELFQKAQITGLAEDYEKAKEMYNKVMQKYAESADYLNRARDQYGRDWAERSRSKVEGIMGDLERHTIDAQFVGRLTFEEKIEEEQTEFDTEYNLGVVVKDPIDDVVYSGRKSTY